MASQTQTGKGMIVGPATVKTITGIANITVKTGRNITGKAKMLSTVSATPKYFLDLMTGDILMVIATQ